MERSLVSRLGLGPRTPFYPAMWCPGDIWYGFLCTLPFELGCPLNRFRRPEWRLSTCHITVICNFESQQKVNCTSLNVAHETMKSLGYSCPNEPKKPTGKETRVSRASARTQVCRCSPLPSLLTSSTEWTLVPASLCAI